MENYSRCNSVDTDDNGSEKGKFSSTSRFPVGSFTKSFLDDNSSDESLSSSRQTATVPPAESFLSRLVWRTPSISPRSSVVDDDKPVPPECRNSAAVNPDFSTPHYPYADKKLPPKTMRTIRLSDDAPPGRMTGATKPHQEASGCQPP